jgi:hypothetical protein
VKVSRIYPARQADKQDVLIRVVAKEGDKPTPELDVLRLLSTEKAQAHPQNIALPILQEFVCDGWTFVKMPCLDSFPAFYSLKEVFDAIHQLVRSRCLIRCISFVAFRSADIYWSSVSLPCRVLFIFTIISLRTV